MATPSSGAPPASPPDRQGGGRRSPGMLPERRERPALESALVRLVATAGVVGIGVALGAILTSQHVAGWIVGLVVALVAVILSAILWSSRRL
jgi:protein-S-isoprenylcysteine O-methyltransferase Ste14